MIDVKHLFVYPVKSLGGIELTQSFVTATGLKHDRRYMLVDSSSRFITQREFPKMSLLRPAFHEDGFRISVYRNDSTSQVIPYQVESGEIGRVQIFSETCRAVYAGAEHDKFFSSFLGIECRLVFMKDDDLRQVDTRYAEKGDHTSFTDGYPVHIIGTASLDDLNSRLDEKIGWERFRPGIVINTSMPFEEDELDQFAIGDASFKAVKKCGRCVMTTIRQNEGETSKEPLRTLASYRTRNNKIYFGQYAVVRSNDKVIRIGDRLSLKAEYYPEL